MKRVLVTGGNKGIGRAICQLLLEKYPQVHVLLGSRDLSRGQEAIQELQSSAGPSSASRLDLIQIDTSSDESVQTAASELKGQKLELYGIVNNAGIGFNYTTQETINTNYFGPRRVNDAFLPLLQKDGGRIVNVSSASAPYFISACHFRDLKKKLSEPWRLKGGIAELDDLAKTIQTKDGGYGASKALLNAYTVLHSKQEPRLIINAVTPGWIQTDITAGQGATSPPSKGAVPPVWCLMSEDLINVPSGRYYGSDCVRSPLHEYRDPGTSAYHGP